MILSFFSKHFTVVAPVAVVPAAVTNSFPDFPNIPRPWIDNEEDLEDE